jgi:hypothetical protein
MTVAGHPTTQLFNRKTHSNCLQLSDDNALATVCNSVTTVLCQVQAVQ